MSCLLVPALPQSYAFDMPSAFWVFRSVQHVCRTALQPSGKRFRETMHPQRRGLRRPGETIFGERIHVSRQIIYFNILQDSTINIRIY